MENKSDKGCLPALILLKQSSCASAFMCYFVGLMGKFQSNDQLDCSASGSTPDGKRLKTRNEKRDVAA